MTNTTSDIINDLRERGAFLMPPAEISEIKQQSLSLQAWSHYKIPDDYARLLEHADGIQGPGFTLYGIKSQSLAGGQRVPDLLRATLEAADKGIISDGLMLGDAQGNTLIVYSKEFREYQVLDRVTEDVIYRYKYIEDFIRARINIYDSIINKDIQ